MKCYINKETGEVKSIVDWDGFDADMEEWEQDLKTIQTEWKAYTTIEKMSSRQAFEVMSSFAEKVASRGISSKLIRALNGRKPFRNFKYQVDNHEETRQRWFKHKAEAYINYVVEELEEEYEVPAELQTQFKQTNQTIDLDGVTLVSVKNDVKWEVDADTLFEFEQSDNLVTAVYHGGNIVHGNIIGHLAEDQLQMVFHCLTQKGKLKSGYGLGRVTLD